MRQERIVIIGAGIGGLAAALSLAQRGFTPSIYEKSAELEEVGAGLQLSPNAFRILEALGLGEQLQPYIAEPKAIVVRRGEDGCQIARMSLLHARQRWGSAYATLHRADLQRVLLDAVAEARICLHLASPVEMVDSTGRFQRNGAWDEADVMIGADGLWSTVRAGIKNSPSPRFAHRRAWRSTISASDAPDWLCKNETGLWLGPGAHLVHYPVRMGNEINLVAIGRSDDADRYWSKPGAADSILKNFGGWTAPVRDLLICHAGWRSWPLFDGQPPGAMTQGNLAQGRLAILGDAAHPMLPFLAQGAAMAIEDAAVLAVRLADETRDIPARLAAYSAARLPRVARAQTEARKNGERYHWTGVKARLRDLGMMAMGGERLLHLYDWLYGWTPPCHDRSGTT